MGLGLLGLGLWRYPCLGGVAGKAVGTGDKFDPDSTKPMPAGSVVVHYAGKVHYDGAKDEPCEVIIYGMGPATTTRVGQ